MLKSVFICIIAESAWNVSISILEVFLEAPILLILSRLVLFIFIMLNGARVHVFNVVFALLLVLVVLKVREAIKSIAIIVC